ncbi:hypothetical protein E0H73_18875 [Kribbella pittospori]|uniref:Uncharacterized protein n=1 Tax=Kribbella pittospori TaxID=722689 RepID=A0A4R0KLX1_9ACTN|nr:hypothetical protein [Kribbella pittospori]TCC61299.1 hypothetical protein E0H73_18875 [Kribbella pittospori]
MPEPAEDTEPPAARPREEPTATRRWRWTEAALLVVGVLGLILVGIAGLVFVDALPQVDPSQLGHWRTPRGSSIDGGWLVWALISSLVLIAITGLPISRLAGHGSVRGAVAQGIGGLVVVFWAVATSLLANGFYFMGPSEGCFYDSCWPLHEQIWATLIPGVLTGIVMLVMALLVNRLAWWIRALVPAVGWVALLLIQHAVWVRYLLPLFQARPN